MLAQLGARYRLGVLSNANGTVRAKLERLGLARHFELIVDSHEEGIEKPDPAIFRVTLDRMGVEASEAAYVGDMLHVDVAGARAAGLLAVLFDPWDLHAGADCLRVATLADVGASSVASADNWRVCSRGGCDHLVDERAAFAEPCRQVVAERQDARHRPPT